MTFDLVAPVYDWLARLVFGRTLESAQQAAWQPLRLGGDVLVLGGGTGAFLPNLLREKQPRRLLYIEASAAMLRQAKARTMAEPFSNLVVEFRHGTETSLRPDETFDDVLLPFVLDVYPPDFLRQQMLPRLRSALRPGGALVVTDFDRPSTAFQRFQMALMLTFFRVTATIPVRSWTDWPALLHEAGFVEQYTRRFRRGQVRAGYWIPRSATAAPRPAARR